MTKAHVLKLVKEQRNERGIVHWESRFAGKTGLSSFGLGLTQQRKIAKQIGRDAKLAAELWQSDVYDLKVIGLLIDDPKAITREQAERQVEQLGGGYLAHVFSSCDATLAKSPIAFPLAKDWMDSEHPVRRRCAYGLLYELSKKNPKGMDDDFLGNVIDRIQSSIHDEDMWVRESMGAALMGIGKRNVSLNKKAIKAARAIGPLDIDYGDDNSCEPLDVLKHLTSDYLKKKFAKE